MRAFYLIGAVDLYMLGRRMLGLILFPKFGATRQILNVLPGVIGSKQCGAQVTAENQILIIDIHEICVND